MSTVTLDEARAHSSSEQQSDVDFVCQLERVTSLVDVIHADADSSWISLLHGPIVTSSGRPCQQPYPQSPLRSDEKVSSRPARRSLFARASTPLRDIGNTAPRSSYRRCASDTAAAAGCRTPPPLTKKSHSMSSAALSAVTDNDDHRLVGDFSRPLCLPVISDSKHCDLNLISHHTVAMLLQNEYSDVVEKFTIVDCRYPYEYDGGHILGAKNLYSKDAIVAEFLQAEVEPRRDAAANDKRRIVVFHCEFSSERAPRLLRFLRNKDRELHCDSYPALRHPELYLLHGGYCQFYNSRHGDLCEPNDYQPMSDRRFAVEQARYRAQSRLYLSSCRSRPLPSVTRRASAVIQSSADHKKFIS